jgi:hypothetical protein
LKGAVYRRAGELRTPGFTASPDRLARAVLFRHHDGMIPRVITSGGQTGADRAALDAALAAGVATGGWVPKGRRAEDGPIPDRYPNLRETDADDYETRTRWNVRDSDATLIVSHGPLAGGSKLTEAIAREIGKPLLHVDLSTTSIAEAAEAVRSWLGRLDGETLNVAGPRASGDPEIYRAVYEIVTLLVG